VAGKLPPMLERFTAGHDDPRVTHVHESSSRDKLDRDIANITRAFNKIGSGFKKHVSKGKPKSSDRDVVGAGAQFTSK
jgi:hypothetical protein